VLAEQDQLVRVREGKRAQNNRIHRGEHGAVRPNRECQDENDGNRKGWRSPRETPCRFQVEPQSREQSGTVDFAQLLLDLLPAAEFENRLTAGFRRLHPFRDIRLREFVDVERDFQSLLPLHPANGFSIGASYAPD
jgi:hypothetical protein